MPELDVALLCDWVRVENGIGHVVAACVDTIHAPSTPWPTQLGIFARITLGLAECGRPHRLEVILQDVDGKVLDQMHGNFAAPRPGPEHPVGWPVGMLLGINRMWLLPELGRYSFEIMLNDHLAKSLPIRVLPAPADSGAPVQ